MCMMICECEGGTPFIAWVWCFGDVFFDKHPCNRPWGHLMHRLLKGGPDRRQGGYGRTRASPYCLHQVGSWVDLGPCHAGAWPDFGARWAALCSFGPNVLCAFLIAHFGMYSILMSYETCIYQNLWRMLVKSPNSKFWSLTFVLFYLKVGGRNTS